jgi:hypothetical protein
VSDLLQRHFRGNRIGRQHEHDSVSAPDQGLDPLPPVLEGINLGSVDQRLEAARLERRFEPIGEGHVFSGIRDEDPGAWFGAFLHRLRIRTHRRIPPRADDSKLKPGPECCDPRPIDQESG